jgi:hypothetical protein
MDILGPAKHAGIHLDRTHARLKRIENNWSASRMENLEERIVAHVPRGTMLAVERAALEARLRPSELVRRLLLDGLAASGFDLPGAVRCSEPIR